MDHKRCLVRWFFETWVLAALPSPTRLIAARFLPRLGEGPHLQNPRGIAGLKSRGTRGTRSLANDDLARVVVDIPPLPNTRFGSGYAKRDVIWRADDAKQAACTAKGCALPKQLIDYARESPTRTALSGNLRSMNTPWSASSRRAGTRCGSAWCRDAVRNPSHAPARHISSGSLR